MAGCAGGLKLQTRFFTRWRLSSFQSFSIRDCPIKLNLLPPGANFRFRALSSLLLLVRSRLSDNSRAGTAPAFVSLHQSFSAASGNIPRR